MQITKETMQGWVSEFWKGAGLPLVVGDRIDACTAGVNGLAKFILDKFDAPPTEPPEK